MKLNKNYTKAQHNETKQKKLKNNSKTKQHNETKQKQTKQQYNKTELK